MTRRSRRLRRASERWTAELRSAIRPRSSRFSAAVRPRSRIRKTAEIRAAPVTPANIASCMTSTVLKESAESGDAASCASARPALYRTAAAEPRRRRDAARKELVRAWRAGAAGNPSPESDALAGSADPALRGCSPGMSCFLSPPDRRAARCAPPVHCRRSGGAANHHNNACANRREEACAAKIRPDSLSTVRPQYLVAELSLVNSDSVPA